MKEGKDGGGGVCGGVAASWFLWERTAEREKRATTGWMQQGGKVEQHMTREEGERGV